MTAKHFTPWILLFAITPALVMSEPATMPLPVAEPATQQVSPEGLARLHALVGGMVDEGKHAGAATMVVRNGKIIDWQNWGMADIDDSKPIQNDTIFRIYSMTKVITSVAALQLVEQGKLELDQEVVDIIPELKGLKVYKSGTADDMVLEDVRTPMTVRMLLNHTAGFTYAFFKTNPVHDVYDESDLWKGNSLDDFLEVAAELPLLRQPGADYNYGISDDILAIVIERVSGVKFEDYIQRNITDPLGMVDTAYDLPESKWHRLATVYKYDDDGALVAEDEDKLLSSHPMAGKGINSGGGGMFSTTGDYARFAQCLLNGGELEGVRIIQSDTLALAMEDSLPEGSFAFGPDQGWGLISGLQRAHPDSQSPLTPGSFTWSGAATTHFFADPSEQLIGIIMVQQFPYDPHQLFGSFRNAVYAAIE